MPVKGEQAWLSVVENGCLIIIEGLVDLGEIELKAGGLLLLCGDEIFDVDVVFELVLDALVVLNILLVLVELALIFNYGTKLLFDQFADVIFLSALGDSLYTFNLRERLCDLIIFTLWGLLNLSGRHGAQELIDLPLVSHFADGFSEPRQGVFVVATAKSEKLLFNISDFPRHVFVEKGVLVDNPGY